ncbi:MAG: CHAD domain-containing protein [Solirubrobacterales bacterium]
MARARPIDGLGAEEPYASAAAKIVAVRAREVADHSEGVLDVAEIDHVHDMRVATRRLRAALEVFEPCFPAPQFAEALAEVKAIADALGERRDRDVTIAALDGFAESLASPDRRGVASLIERLAGEQSEANAALEAFVSPERLAALSERLFELVVEAEVLAGSGHP